MKLQFNFWLAIGLCLSLLWACSAPINSFESADRYLREKLLPKIGVESQLVSDVAAENVVIPALSDPVPDPNTFPLYGAKPSSDSNIAYIEIYSSAEKANMKVWASVPFLHSVVGEKNAFLPKYTPITN